MFMRKPSSYEDREKRNSRMTITVQLGYNDLCLCVTSAITSYIQFYQVIPLKAHVFSSLLSATCLRSSTSDIMALPAIGFNTFFQEADYFQPSSRPSERKPLDFQTSMYIPGPESDNNNCNSHCV